MRPVLVPVLLSAVAIAGCGGSDDAEVRTTTTVITETTVSSAPAPEPAEPAALGDAQLYEDDALAPPTKLEVTVESLNLRATPDDPDLAQAIAKPDHQWARLRVRVQNQGTDTAQQTAASFALVDANDQQYKGEDVSPGGVFGTPFSGGALAPARAMAGSVAVQVPPKARIVRVEFAEFGSGSPVGWAVH